MSEFSGYFDRLADQQIRERTTPRQARADQHRLRGRHALAARLRTVAERLDG